MWRWSKTADSNGSIDPAINFAEGQAAKTLNNSSRAMMASLASYRDDVSGVLLTTGTAAAYAVASNQNLTILADGFSFAFRVHVANASPCTINIDGRGAVPIRLSSGVNISANALTPGKVFRCTYFATAGEVLVHSVPSAASGFPAGTRLLFQQATAPTGWTKDAGVTDAMLRVTGGTTMSGGTADFATVFAPRTISRANLPNITLATDFSGDHVHPHNPAGSALVLGPYGGLGATGSGSGLGAAGVGPGGNHKHTTESINGGVTQQPLNFDVMYASAIIAVKD